MAMKDLPSVLTARPLMLLTAISTVSVSVSVSLALLPSSARADEPPPAPASGESTAGSQDDPLLAPQPATRRNGLIVGLQGNAGPSMVAGYPLDLKKIGHSTYYTETPIGLGGSGLLWVGVSLKDWLSVGLGGTLDGLVAGDNHGFGYGGVLRLEAYPLWSYGGIGEDLGVTFDAGASAIAVTQEDRPKVNIIDGGAASFIGGGVFYEGIRYWRVSAGPGIYAGYMWSDTVRHGSVMLDFRVTLYAGDVTGSKKATAAR